MATSSKVRFNLDTLRAKALESIDLRIAYAQTVADSFFDDAALAERLAEWRANQERKISVIFNQLGEGGVDDYRLSKFSLDPIPSVDRYDKRQAEERLRHLIEKRSQIEAKAEAITPDEDGSVSLTKTQLADFFGL
jgi:hypothetical protein